MSRENKEEWERFSREEQEADPLVTIINDKISNYENQTDEEVTGLENSSEVDL